MSILGPIAESLSPNYAFVGVLILFGCSAALAIGFRVFLPRAVVGPQRLSVDQPAVLLVMAVGMGLCSWFLASALYANAKGIGTPHAGETAARSLTANDWVYLANVPPVLFFGTLLLADWAVGGVRLLRGLGFTLRRSASGVATGVISALVIIPPTYLVTAGTDWVYKRVKYEHANEHELLKVMREPERHTVHWLLIVAAVLVAPIFEEFLFRGHVQTLIQRMFNGITERRRASRARPGGFPVTAPIPLPQPITASGQVAETTAPKSVIVLEPMSPVLPVWQAWASIIITSILFAMVHDPWMRPPIFFLSLGLGYCYERTGNLWTNITVHCLFNSVSTFVFLNYQ